MSTIELDNRTTPIEINGNSYDTYDEEYYYVVHICDNSYNYYIKAYKDSANLDHSTENLRSACKIVINDLIIS